MTKILAGLFLLVCSFAEADTCFVLEARNPIKRIGSVSFTYKVLMKTRIGAADEVCIESHAPGLPPGRELMIFGDAKDNFMEIQVMSRGDLCQGRPCKRYTAVAGHAMGKALSSAELASIRIAVIDSPRPNPGAIIDEVNGVTYYWVSERY